jgi:hypothetical protein
VFDDSRSVLFDPSDGWVAPRPDYEVQDWVFFCYGHDYKEALAEYTRFGGPVPLIPRFILGAWWSRYWAYSAQDLKDLVCDFERYGLPLDVLVIDMDWHTPHSWTGYTWNREFFPDPPSFLQWVHDKGLRATLNLHPAQGVQAFEEIYPRFAEAMGVDPESGEAVAFRIADKRFVKHYFELLHHPMEDEGVDFWWVDWQQGEVSEVKGLDPLLWLNHLHFHDSTRRGKRPMLYSRWGGLGNHRYYIGFSGDTFVGWSALQFQPYFTATASNVAYGWWSHDIGGHMGGATEPELFARWVQFGALSPCLRLHATKDPRIERRPWKYPDEVYHAAKQAFCWRYQLIPYIYTMARIASDTAVSLCRPMYYEYPEEDAAYVARYQYFFGDQMIVAPIVHPADPETGMASVDVWVPEGTWIDYVTKETFTGPRWIRLVGDLNRMPILVKAGAILPLAPEFREVSSPHLASGTVDAIPSDHLVLSIFSGANGVFRLYEDDGITEAYKRGQCEWTGVETQMVGEDTWEVHIAPVEGGCDVLPDQRRYELRLEGSQRPNKVTVDGVQIADWVYDSDLLITTIQVPEHDKRRSMTVVAIAEGKISALGESRDREVRRSDVSRLLGEHCPQDAGDIDAVLGLDVPGRRDAIARLGGPFAHIVEFVAPEDASQQLGRVIVGAPICSDKSYDIEATFTLFGEGWPERCTIRVERTTDSHILDAPFAFDGRARTMHWEVEVKITWRGETLTYMHQSRPLFPAVYVWRAIVYNRKVPIGLEQVMTDEGSVNGDLDWGVYVQTSEDLVNVNQPYAVLFFEEHMQELQAGEPLAGYLTTTVISPDERDVVFLFKPAGPTEIYLNGERVEEATTGEDEREGDEYEDMHPYLRNPHRTVVMRLREGTNTLLVHNGLAPERVPWWFFGGAFATPDGCLMTDLTFE